MNISSSNKNNITVYFMYAILFTLFLFKMFFYANEIKDYPDQLAQLSYVVYMEEHPSKIIPEFDRIKMVSLKDNPGEHNTNYTELKKETATCYLGHPPFYYKFLQICDVIKIEQGKIYADIAKIYHINICITALTMILILYSGFRRLLEKQANWSVHFMYVSICTCLPLYGYVGSGINNDNLCNLGIAVFLIGLFCYFEQGSCYRAYWMVGTGVLLCFFSKLTSGLIVFLVCTAIVLLEIWKNRNIKIICNKFFISTFPLYFVTGSYFVAVYAKYGMIQPDYRKLVSAEEFQSSSFFVEESVRMKLSFWEDCVHFFKGLWDTWVSTYSKSYMVTRTGLLAVPFLLVLILFFIQAILGVYETIKNKNLSITVIPFLFAFACIITIIIQFAKHWESYLKNGYLGGCQARYYMPCLPAIAFGTCGFIQRFDDAQKKSRQNMMSACLAIVGFLMIYADFFYYANSYYRLPV